MAPINGSLLEFHSNYSPVFYHFRDKAVYSSKIAIFYTLRALDAPSRGSGPNITMSDKPEEGWVDQVVKFRDTFSCFDTIPACDGQVDRHLHQKSAYQKDNLAVFS